MAVLPCPPEIVLERLDTPALWRAGPLVLGRKIQALAGQVWRRLAGVRGNLSSPSRPVHRDEPEQRERITEDNYVK